MLIITNIVTDGTKHPSLLHSGENYDGKKFYNAGLGMQEKGVELSLRKKETKEKTVKVAEQ
jgi:hypothetical protein